MSAAGLLRTLTPLGWGALAAGVAIVVLLAGHGLGLRWDPFGLSARRLAAAEAREQTAVADAAARRLEVEGAEAAARRLDVHQRNRLELERATGLAEARARSAHDAETPLDPDRIARLVDHDRELCRLAPALCVSAPADLADGGD